MRIYPLLFDSMLNLKFQVVFSPSIFFRIAEKRGITGGFLRISAVLCRFGHIFCSDLLLLVVYKIDISVNKYY